MRLAAYLVVLAVVGLAAASGTSDYVVSAGWSCWQARRVRDGAETPMPTRADGCTTLRDTAGLFDRAVDLLG